MLENLEDYLRDKREITDILENEIKDKNLIQIINTVKLLKNQFVCIYDSVRDSLIYQKNIQELLGYDVVDWTILELFQKFHPEDINPLIEIWNRIKTHYFTTHNQPFESFSFTTRLIKADGTVMHVLNQEFVLEYRPEDNYILTLNLATDISYLQPGNEIKIILTGPGSDELQFDDILKSKDTIPKISKREMEILKMIAQGMDSLSISNALIISVHTVNTHRRNLINRFNVDNTAQLISYLTRRKIL
jgi:DNA-binding CsgD family transcriptional regulator